MKFPWKQSHRSVPPSIATEVARIRSDVIIVAATKKIPVKTIAAGQYAHLGLHHDGNSFEITDSVMPAVSVGKFADRNRNGWEVKRRDLPKTTKSVSFEAPNWHSSGTHTISVSR